MAPVSNEEKSFSAGFGSLAFLTSLLWLGVYLDLWNGFYADMLLVRTMFVAFVLIAPLLHFVSRRSDLPLTRQRAILIASVASFVACIGSAIYRERSIIEANRGFGGWIVISIACVHLLAFFMTTHPLIPDRFWKRMHIRFAAQTVVALAVVQTIVFALILFYIAGFLSNRDFKDGFFSPTAAHLNGFEPAEPPPWNAWDGSELKVLTYNAWDIEGWIPQFIASPSRDLEARLRVLPKAIAGLRADIVMFQEVWKFQTRSRLARELKKFGYDYSVQGSDSFMSWFGVSNGLLIVSRLPLDGFQATTFDVDTRFDEGPLFARKGVIRTRVNVAPPNAAEKWIDLYDTHLGGFTTQEKNGQGVSFVKEEQDNKFEQTRHLIRFIRETNSSKNLILGADLNTHPYVFDDGRYGNLLSLEYTTLVCHGDKETGCLELVDSAAPPRGSLEKSSEMYTYDTKRNYYASTGRFAYEPRGRIDYVFSKGSLVEPLDAHLVLDEVVLSDHYGVLATYRLKTN